MPPAYSLTIQYMPNNIAVSNYHYLAYSFLVGRFYEPYSNSIPFICNNYRNYYT